MTSAVGRSGSTSCTSGPFSCCVTIMLFYVTFLFEDFWPFHNLEAPAESLFSASGASPGGLWGRPALPCHPPAPPPHWLCACGPTRPPTSSRSRNTHSTCAPARGPGIHRIPPAVRSAGPPPGPRARCQAEPGPWVGPSRTRIRACWWPAGWGLDVRPFSLWAIGRASSSGAKLSGSSKPVAPVTKDPGLQSLGWWAERTGLGRWGGREVGPGWGRRRLLHWKISSFTAGRSRSATSSW